MLENGDLTSTISLFLANVVALILSIGFHEFSHVLVAFSLGDRTGQRAGRLTVNPLRHLDPLGTALILLGAPIGWGKPAPFAPEQLRYRRFGSAFVALGGPLSNIVLMTIGGLALRLSLDGLGPENLLVIFLQAFVIMNASLAIFNLVPLPPLDGSWVLLSLLPASSPAREFLTRYGTFLLLGLLVADLLLGIRILTPLIVSGVTGLVGSLGLAPYL